MQRVPAAFEHPAGAAEFRRPAHRDGVELYRAHIVRHAFEPHAHAGFGVIGAGVERLRHRGAEHLAPAGWRYRRVYVEPGVVEAASGARAWWFVDAVAHDAQRAAHATKARRGSRR